MAVGTEGDKEGDKTVARQPKSVAVDKRGEIQINIT